MNLQENIRRILREETGSEWRTISMDELYGYINRDKDPKTFVKPKFPTRRWGNVYTKDSTTDVASLNKMLKQLKDEGFYVRKKIDKENNLGKFYKIEIKNNPDSII